MRQRNICKFTSPSSSESISVSCFVLETNSEIMKNKITLSKYRAILVNEGEGEFLIDSFALSLNKGTLLFGLKNEELVVLKNDNLKYMYIDFDGSRAEELLTRFRINLTNRCFYGFDGLIPLWEESLSRALENTIDLVAESMIIYTFSRLNEDVSLRDNTLHQILQLTEERFNDFELSLTVIAEELGYNAKYLSHLFMKKTNKTYSQYLRCLRMKYAISLFDNGIDSVKNVALLSGFSDPLYFSTVFKKTMGLSPKEYLAKNKH